MYKIITIVGLSLSLGACQTTQESAYSAERVCYSAGLKRGSKSFDRCANAAYQENRRQADQASSQVAMGIAAGVIGGVIIGANSNRQSNNYYYGGSRPFNPYYGPRPYYGPPRGGFYGRPNGFYPQPRVMYGPRPGWGGYGRGW